MKKILFIIAIVIIIVGGWFMLSSNQTGKPITQTENDKVNSASDLPKPTSYTRNPKYPAFSDPDFPISWSVSDVHLAYPPETHDGLITIAKFISKTNLEKVSFRVTPNLDPFMIVSRGAADSYLVPVSANKEMEIGAFVHIDRDAQPGVILGGLEVLAGEEERLIARLPITFEIVDDTVTVGPKGGFIKEEGGATATIAPGSFEENTHIAIRNRDDLGGINGHLPPLGYRILTYLDLDTNGVSSAHPIKMSIPKPPELGQVDYYIITRLEFNKYNNVVDEELVSLATATENTITSFQGDLPFSGIYRDGVYVFYASAVDIEIDLGFIVGTVTGVDDRPVAGANIYATVWIRGTPKIDEKTGDTISTDFAWNVSPFSIRTNTDGRYVVPVVYKSGSSKTVYVATKDPVTGWFSSIKTVTVGNVPGGSRIKSMLINKPIVTLDIKTDVPPPSLP